VNVDQESGAGPAANFLDCFCINTIQLHSHGT
jgi:hypothetical protein